MISLSLTNISKLATDTRDNVLPSVVNHQRTAINLERLGRFAETIHRADDAKIRRQYKLAARILSQDSVFEEDGALNREVMDTYNSIEQLATMRDQETRSRANSDQLLHSFTSGNPTGKAMLSLARGRLMLSLLFQADKTNTLDDLNNLEKEFTALANATVTVSKKQAAAIRTAHQFLTQCRTTLEIANIGNMLWLQIHDSLENLSGNLTTSAAITANNRFTTITQTADKAMQTTLVAAGVLLLALLILLFLTHRDIVQPILLYVRGIDDLFSGKQSDLPRARIRELNDIRKAVKRSGSLMNQLASRTEALETANAALEEEIEERKKIQHKLAESKERAEEADRAKSNFLAGMSHEIRTPMNTILGMADLMLDTELTQEQRQYIEISHSSGEMLLNIINDVLDLSKIESGEIGLEKAVITVEDFLNRTQEIVTGRVVQKNLDFSIDVGPEVPEQLIGDPIRLRQVLVNLIDNGVKFTDDGSVRLTIHAQDPANPASLTFKVIDTGIGIPKHVQEQIFHRFTQADASTTRQYGGTGLGLPICRKLVELMGGNIELESTLGQGSTFIFTIDLALPDEHKRTDMKRPKDIAELIDSLTGTPTRILVAEDSDSNQALIELYFKKTDCTLDFAVDGREAVNRFKEASYDLILMDIQMPVMDGYAATREIRSIEREQELLPIPIVAVTANAFKEDQLRCLDAGCTGYLAKPISKAGLLLCVTQQLKGDL